MNKNINHVVSFSTGLSSAICAELVLKRFYKKGSSKIIVTFMDTRLEDADNYRFMVDCYKRWESQFPDVIFKTLADGRTPYEVYEDQGVIPAVRFNTCSRELKWYKFIQFISSLEGESVVYIGFDYSEAHRITPVKKNYESIGVKVDFPLLWRPILGRTYYDIVLNDWGIRPPRMYDLGYSHANCGGMCVKQGQADWLRTLVHFPERFEQVANWEDALSKRVKEAGRGERYMIRVIRDGTTTFISLKQFREMYVRGELEDRVVASSTQCINCGIGFSSDEFSLFGYLGDGK